MSDEPPRPREDARSVEPHESAVSPPIAADAPPTLAEPPPRVPGRTATERDAREQRGGHALALLLAAAAVATAVIGARASFVANDSSSAWQQAVRAETKRGALNVESIRYVYQNEAPGALRLLAATIRAEEYRREAQGSQPPAAIAALLAEVAVQDQLVSLYRGGSLIAREGGYELPGGGYDLVKRLADTRRPEDAAVDPDGPQAEGDRLARRAVLGLAATIPVSVAFFAGALAQIAPRRRRILLVAGTLFLAIGVGAALLVEVGA